MLGAGGELVEPLSESAELGAIFQDLKRALRMSGSNSPVSEVLRDAEYRVVRLLGQISEGYHRNPRHSAIKLVEKTSDDFHEFRYTHRGDDTPYKHPFARGVELWAATLDGQRIFVVKHKAGKPLWDDF